MTEARWTIWLLNKGEPSVAYFVSMKEPWTRQRLLDAAEKVFDGSDADAMLLTRSDKTPEEYGLC